MEKRALDFYTEIVSLLSRGVVNRRLYSSEHPQLGSFINDILLLFRAYCRTAGQDLFIGIYDNNFIYEGKRVFGSAAVGKELIALTERLHCGGFILKRGLNARELTAFFNVATSSVPIISSLAEARELLFLNRVEHIVLGAPYKGSLHDISASNWQGEDRDGGFAIPISLKKELFDSVSEAISAAGLGVSIDITKTRSVSEFMLKYIHTSFDAVLESVVYPDFENYTVNHSIRVAALAVYVASRMEWEEKDLLAIGVAALLHDIGKSVIPDEILMKKSGLSKAEFDIIRAHPKAGTEILVQQKNLMPYTLAACWGHHIRYDGGGYPGQESWAVRHPVSSLLQVCDVFEALTAVRPYKAPMSPEKAFHIMLKDSGAFHPALLASFIKLVGLYPSGTQVKLSDGRYGIVSSQTDILDRPKIRISIDPKGRLLARKNQYEIDLATHDLRNVEVERLVLQQEDMMEVFEI